MAGVGGRACGLPLPLAARSGGCLLWLLCCMRARARECCATDPTAAATTFLRMLESMSPSHLRALRDAGLSVAMIAKSAVLVHRAKAQWRQLLDEETGYYYYYNTENGESQWEAPKAFFDRDGPSVALGRCKWRCKWPPTRRP